MSDLLVLDEEGLEIMLWEVEVMEAMKECSHHLPFSPELIRPSFVYQLIRLYLGLYGVQER